MTPGSEGAAVATYRDRWIECTPTEILVRGYYFPWGTKHIPYAKVRRIQRVQLSPLRGNLRIWGTANPRYWASFDPQRPRKSVGFVLDLGKMVRPFITPLDPDAFQSALIEHSNPEIVDTPTGPAI